MPDSCWNRLRGWMNRIGTGLTIGASGICAGCHSDDSLAGAGLDVRPSAAWRRIDPETRMVPGKTLAAWSGPQGSSLVVYSALPIPGGSAESISASLGIRLRHLPELEIEAQKVVTIDGRTVARVEAVAPGTGDSLAPSSVGKPMNRTSKPLVPTREITLGLADPDQTLFLCWNLPESARDQILPEIEETISRLRLPAAGATSSKTSY